MPFSVVNIGCKVNRVELDAIAAKLIARGASIAGGDEADVVIVNTCTVTGEADKKTRKAVRQALKDNPHARILVTGCAAAMNPQWFDQLDERVSVVSKADAESRAWEQLMTREDVPTSRIPERNLEWIPKREWPASRMGKQGDHADGGTCAEGLDGADGRTFRHAALRIGDGFRARVGIKVQDGCDNACAFCIVHVARGRSRSLPWRKICEEARAYSEAGVRELVLTGINLGAYSDDGRSLASLLETLLEACPNTRFRISSVEPHDIDEDLIELMAASRGRICRHLHLPLQSGSSRVLAEMNRPYDAAAFLALVRRLRQAMPGISLSTDIIAGFPGETDRDFNETLALAREAGFSKIHAFRYSRREGTPAALRKDQVPPDITALRAHRLIELGKELSLDDARRRLGSEELVLVERVGRGTSESYHRVTWNGACPPVGSLVPVRLGEMANDGGFIA